MAIHVPIAVNNRAAFNTTVDMMNSFYRLSCNCELCRFPPEIPDYHKSMGWLCCLSRGSWDLSNGGHLSHGHGLSGVGAFFNDENDFALFLNMVIPFGFFLAFHAKANSKRLLLLVTTGFLLLGNVATFSRGGFVGLVAVGLYCWLRSPRKILSLTVVLLLILVILQLAPEGYWGEMGTIAGETDNPESTARRENLFMEGSLGDVSRPSYAGCGSRKFSLEF